MKAKLCQVGGVMIASSPDRLNRTIYMVSSLLRRDAVRMQPKYSFFPPRFPVACYSILPRSSFFIRPIGVRYFLFESR
jgi:hypothetical protein